MALFGNRKDKDEDSGYVPVESDVELSIPVNLSIFLPDSLVTSDLFLSKLETYRDDTTTRFTTEQVFNLKAVYWFVQQKESRRDDSGPAKYPSYPSSKTAAYGNETYRLDKFLFKFVHSISGSRAVQTPFFLMTDVFFDPNLSYTAKALGIYSSIPKVLSVNFKHHGELHAEKHAEVGETGPNWQPRIAITPDSLKLEKRARPNFFWLEAADAGLF